MEKIEKVILNNELFSIGEKVIENSYAFSADNVKAFLDAIINLQKDLA